MANRPIVSLLPSATEIICALGLRDRLVGVSHECDFPSNVAMLPKVTSSILAHGLSPLEVDQAVAEAGLEGRPLYAVDGALLNSLEPELVVTQGVCAVCAVTEDDVASSLKILPYPSQSEAQVLSLSGVDFDSIMTDICAVGEMAGVFKRAEDLVAELRAAWDALPGPAQGGPRVLMMEWAEPPWFAGHWVPEQVVRAGGRNLFGSPGGLSRRLSWGAIEEADPDMIIVMGCGHGLKENLENARRVFSAGPASALSAVRAGHLWAADANALFSRPGPRIVQGAELLAAIFEGREDSPELAQRVVV